MTAETKEEPIIWLIRGLLPTGDGLLDEHVVDMARRWAANKNSIDYDILTLLRLDRQRQREIAAVRMINQELLGRVAALEADHERNSQK